MDGEYYGSPSDFEYNIGDKLYEFAIMDYEKFDKLKILYTELIEIVSKGKEDDNMDNKVNYMFEMFSKVLECLEFSPYTHFYTQLLIDIIIKTYNTKVLRSDLLVESQIRYKVENRKYFPNKNFLERIEDEFNTTLLMHEWSQRIDKVSSKKHTEYIKFFETIRDRLVQDFMEKKTDLKQRLELISKYSKNSVIRNLKSEERIYLYEIKKVFNLNYLNTNPAHALFLDTKFKTKYICSEGLTTEEKSLDIEELGKKIQEKHIASEEVYELENAEEQIRFEIFKVIQNNFVINRCENCGRLFIPITESNNKNQKGRTDQKYCNNLYLDTGKTCREIGALNKRKEKVKNSPILIELQREYKRMYGLHYNHQKEFKKKKFKEWSQKARELKNRYTDDELGEFKVELRKLSNLYWKIDEK